MSNPILKKLLMPCSIRSLIAESLRLHTPTGFARKRCISAYNLPAAKPGKYAEYTIPEGMIVYIPICAIMRDPEYYPDPDKFDPERFNENRASSIPKCAYLPFGEGPRQCLGN